MAPVENLCARSKNIQIVERRVEEDDDRLAEQNPSEEIVVDKIITTLFKNKHKFKINKIQNAMYEDKNVKSHIAELKSGDDAVAFFAKYGNTTPVKFIHCVRDPSSPNPYHLLIEHEPSKLNKASSYYTVSASGIVIIYKAKSKRSRMFALPEEAEEEESGRSDNANKPSEFISLSDWMKEATQFNILINISFFRNYIGSKLLKTWRKNYKRRQFVATRKTLLETLPLCKPAFTKYIVECKGIVKKMSSVNMVSFDKIQSKHVEFEQFKETQKEARRSASGKLENIFDELHSSITSTVENVRVSLENNKLAENAESSYKTLVENRSLNLIKIERLEMLERKRLAQKDFNLLGDYIRLINLIASQSLIDLNQRALNKVDEELNQERQSGLFTTSLIIEDSRELGFTHSKEDVLGALEYIFLENLRIVASDGLRILGIPSYRPMLDYITPDISQITLDLDNCIRTSKQFQKVKEAVEKKVVTDFSECRKKVKMGMQPCLKIENERQNFRLAAWAEAEPRLEDIKAKLSLLREFKKDITDKVKDQNAGIIHVDSKNFRNGLSAFVSDTTAGVLDHLSRMYKQRHDEVKNTLKTLNDELLKRPEKLKEFAAVLTSLEEARVKQTSLEADRADLDTMFKLLTHAGFALGTEDKVNFSNQRAAFEALQANKAAAESLALERNEFFVGLLREAVEKLGRLVQSAEQVLGAEELRRHDTPIDEANKRLEVVREILKRAHAKREKVQRIAGLMRAEASVVLPDLTSLASAFDLRASLWRNFESLGRRWEEWLDGPLRKVEVSAVEREVKEFEDFAGMARRAAGEEDDDLLRAFLARLEELQDLLPLMRALTSKALRDRHMKAILSTIGAQSLLEKPGFPLSELRAHGAASKLEEIEEIVARATGEHTLEVELEQLKRECGELAFRVVRLRETGDRLIVANAAENFTRLEGFLAKAQGMLGSPHLQDARDVVAELVVRLTGAQEMLEELGSLQARWTSLESVFGTEDIARQLATEAARFFVVDRFFREIMLGIAKKPSLLETASADNRARFVEANASLDAVEKMLESFLESKRKAFPRLYFLSNKELVALLAAAQSPAAAQPLVQRCFERIHSLALLRVEDKTLVSGVLAGKTPELLALSEHIDLAQPAEVWLAQLEASIVSALRERLAEGLAAETPERPPLPAQVEQLLESLAFARDTETAIRDGELSALLPRLEAQVETLARLSPGPAAELACLQAINHRDIAARLLAAEVNDVESAEWTSQVRYYCVTGRGRPVESASQPKLAESFGVAGASSAGLVSAFSRARLRPATRPAPASTVIETPRSDVEVRLGSSTQSYGFEFLGLAAGFSCPPQTSRAILALVAARAGFQAGVLWGGEGKSATLATLSAAYGAGTATLSCDAAVEARTTDAFLCGAAQAGLWLVMDRVERLRAEALSAFSCQLASVLLAWREGREECEVGGNRLLLRRSAAVYLTSGQSQFDPLSIPPTLFRTVGLERPDPLKVTEDLLLAGGCRGAAGVARKLVAVVEATQCQLSQPAKLRLGLKTVVDAVSHFFLIRQLNPQAREEPQLAAALREVIGPKLTGADQLLFTNILTDHLGPVDPPEPQTARLALLLASKHNVVVCGPAGTGKSRLIRAACETAGHVSLVDALRFFPGALTPAAVFGSLDRDRGVVHGVFSKPAAEFLEEAARDLAENQSSPTDAARRPIFVFDGHLNCEWLERLHSILDEPAMLASPGGKRTPAGPLRLLFETESLDSASPGFVAKCGLFAAAGEFSLSTELDKVAEELQRRVEPLGREDPRLAELLAPAVGSEFRDALATIIGRAAARRPTSSTVMRRTAAFFAAMRDPLLDGFTAMARKLRGSKTLLKAAEAFHLKESLLCGWGLAVCWAWGSDIPSDEREAFEADLRRAVEPLVSPMTLPNLWEFRLDGEGKFLRWADELIDPIFAGPQPLQRMFVESAESRRLRFLARTSLASELPVLLLGGRRGGKTLLAESLLLGGGQTLRFSAAGADSIELARFLCERLGQSGRDLLPPGPGRLTLLLDDLHLTTTTGPRLPELLRQLLDCGGFHDSKRLAFRRVQATQVLAVADAAAASRGDPPARLARFFTALSFQQPSEAYLPNLYLPLLKGFLGQESDPKLVELAAPIASASAELLRFTTSQFPPTIRRPQLASTARELMFLFQSLTSLHAKDSRGSRELVELWAHESLRVFGDRLPDSDSAMVAQRIAELTASEFGGRDTAAKLLERAFTATAGHYHRVDKMNEFLERAEESLKAVAPHASPPPLASTAAVPLLLRVKRLLSIAGAHCVVFHNAGGWTKTLVQIACHLQHAALFVVDQYTVKENIWKDELKKALRAAADESPADGRRGVAFLLNEALLGQEFVLTDLRKLLQFSDLSSVFKREELDELRTGPGRPSEKKGGLDSGLSAESGVFSAVMRNLHVFILSTGLDDSTYAESASKNSFLVDQFSLLHAGEPNQSDLLQLAISAPVESPLPQEVAIALPAALVELHHAAPSPCVTAFAEMAALAAEAASQRLALLPAKKVRLEAALEKFRLVEGRLSEQLRAAEAESESEVFAREAKAAEEAAVLAKQVEQATAETETLSGRLTVQRGHLAELQSVCRNMLNEAMPFYIASQNDLAQLTRPPLTDAAAASQMSLHQKAVLGCVAKLLGRGDSAEEARRLASDAELIRRLQNFDVTTVPEKIWAQLRAEYLADPEFLAREALAPLADFCINADTYFRKKSEAHPKEIKLRAVEEEVAALASLATEREREAERLRSALRSAEEELSTLRASIKLIREAREKAQLNLSKSQGLIDVLRELSADWASELAQLQNAESSLISDALLWAASVAYLGPLPTRGRKAVLEKWSSLLAARRLPPPPPVGLAALLKLPGAAEACEEPGQLALACRRVPLLVDPCSTGRAFLRASRGEKALLVLASPKEAELPALEAALKAGLTVLIEGAEEPPGPFLTALLEARPFKRGGLGWLRVQGKDLQCAAEFKLLLRSVEPPRWKPGDGVVVVDCTPTGPQAAAWLLTRLDLPRRKDDGRLLKDTADKFFRDLVESPLDPLEDDELLADTRLYAELKKRARDPPAEELASIAAGALLASNLTSLFEMHQRVSAQDEGTGLSLSEFAELVERVIASPDPRLALFRQLSRRHSAELKLAFAFGVATEEAASRGLTGAAQLTRDFATEGRALDEPPTWVGRPVWAALHFARSLSPKLSDLPKTVQKFHAEFAVVLTSPQVNFSSLDFVPGVADWSPVDRFAVLKALRDDRLPYLSREFVDTILGKGYLAPDPGALAAELRAARPHEHVSLVLAPGTDLVWELHNALRDLNLPLKKLVLVALAPQGLAAAREQVKMSQLAGEVVVLIDLESRRELVDELLALNAKNREDFHADYRLVVAGREFAAGPRKARLAPAGSMCEDLARQVRRHSEAFDVAEEADRKPLAFLLLFHTALSHRLCFNGAGWNEPPPLSDDVLDAAVADLPTFLQRDEASLEDFARLVARAYSHKLPAASQQALLLSLFKRLILPGVLGEEGDFLKQLTDSLSVNDLSDSARDFAAAVEASGFEDSARLLGVSPAAFNLRETSRSRSLAKKLRLVCPTSEGLPVRETPDSFEAQRQSLEKMLSYVPDPLEKETVDSSQFSYLQHFKLAEAERYNRLLALVQRDLLKARSAFSDPGNSLSDHLALAEVLTSNRVPSHWAEEGYPSTLSLASWMENLRGRVRTVRQLIREPQSSNFNLAALHRPKALFTMLMSQFIRETKMPAEKIQLEFKFTREFASDKEQSRPQVSGVSLFGFELANASWDPVKLSLRKQSSKFSFEKLPIILVSPTLPKAKPSNLFDAPVLIAPLASNDDPENFVGTHALPVPENESDDFTLAGTTLFLQSPEYSLT